MLVGQKVACVDDVFHPEVAKHYACLPVKDTIYIIRDVVMGVSPRGEPGEVCLYLVGMYNPSSSAPPAYPERGFNAERFRPLKDDRIEDIEEPEPMKVNPPVMVPADPPMVPLERELVEK